MMRAVCLVLVLVGMFVWAGCGAEAEPNGADMSTVDEVDMAQRVDMRVDEDMRALPDAAPDMIVSEDMGAEEDMDAGEDMGKDPLEAPIDKDALFAWLQSRAYEQYPNDGMIHPSNSAHGGAVKVFFNEALDASVKANSAAHPKGSVSVKELYNADMSQLRGWAVSIKTQDDSGDRGQGWYWYEVFSTTSGASPVAAGQGVGLCAGCHSGAARDNVFWPDSQ